MKIYLLATLLFQTTTYAGDLLNEAKCLKKVQTPKCHLEEGYTGRGFYYSIQGVCRSKVRYLNFEDKYVVENLYTSDRRDIKRPIRGVSNYWYKSNIKFPAQVLATRNAMLSGAKSEIVKRYLQSKSSWTFANKDNAGGLSLVHSPPNPYYIIIISAI